MYITSVSLSLSYSKLTHPVMNLNTAAEISAVLGVPLAAFPVGLAIHGKLKSFRPKNKLKKWSIRIEQISATVASQGNMITPEEMEKFLIMLVR